MFLPNILTACETCVLSVSSTKPHVKV